MDSVQASQTWPAEHVAVAVVDRSGHTIDTAGEQDRRFPLASVTKLLSAYAVLVAVEEGALEWTQPAGPDGATVQHLIAHASGLAFDSERVMAAPGTRRIYSNAGFDVLAQTLYAATGIPFPDYLAEAVLSPLGMASTSIDGSAAAGAVSSCADLAAFVAELQRPRLLARPTLTMATAVAFPGLDGVLPGYGRQRPNDWGLGFELRDSKHPHWTGGASSPGTFGHFGQSGTFVWVDPQAGAACVALTDRDFGEWAIDVWPVFTDSVLHELGSGG